MIPTSRQNIVMRQWQNISKNRAHMEELILKLMANPATEAEHLAQAHAMYSDVCMKLSEVSHHVDNILRTGSTTGWVKPEPLGHHMLSCTATKTRNEKDCNCHDWE